MCSFSMSIFIQAYKINKQKNMKSQLLFSVIYYIVLYLPL